MHGRSRGAWHWLWFATLAGCARTYDATEPRVVRHEAVNVVASRLRLAPPFVGTDARLRTGARSGTMLRGAKLAPLANEPCARGTKFAQIKQDGVEQTEGPLDLAGNHDLDVTFVNTDGDPWVQPLAVDLELGTPSGTSCARVALNGDAGAPTWKMAEDSAGLLTMIGGRGFPFSTTHAVGIEPLWLMDVRVGAAFGRTRLWGEFAGGQGRTTGYGDIVLSAGGDYAVWESGRFAFMLGAAYEVVFNLYKPPEEQRGSQRFTLHGPRLTPSLSYTLLENALRGHLPAGRRTLYLELEVPTSAWFGIGDAPQLTLVPGLGLSIAWAI
jgi:hypothetical protein